MKNPLGRIRFGMKRRLAPDPRGLLAMGLLISLLAAPSFDVRAQAFRTDAGYVRFTSSVPLHTFDGESDRLVGRISLTDSTVDFYVDLTTLETGIGKRDKDMRRSLETDRFQFAEFFGKLISPFDPARQGPQPAIVKGDFKVHGVSRQMEISGTLEKKAAGLEVEAVWTVNLKDFNIEPPSLLIVRVDEVQKVYMKASLAPEAEKPG